jgi:hypothetical protein
MWYRCSVREGYNVPQQNMTPKLGKSSSPVVNRVIDNSKNVQQPVKGTGQAFNKKPIKR